MVKLTVFKKGHLGWPLPFGIVGTPTDNFAPMGYHFRLALKLNESIWGETPDNPEQVSKLIRFTPWWFPYERKGSFGIGFNAEDRECLKLHLLIEKDRQFVTPIIAHLDNILELPGEKSFWSPAGTVKVGGKRVTAYRELLIDVFLGMPEVLSPSTWSYLVWAMEVPEVHPVTLRPANRYDCPKLKIMGRGLITNDELIPPVTRMLAKQPWAWVTYLYYGGKAPAPHKIKLSMECVKFETASIYSFVNDPDLIRRLRRQPKA